MGDFDRIEETCCYQANVIAGGTTTGLIAALGDIVIEDPFSFNYFANFDPESELENGGLSVHVDKTFGFADLTSITSYRESNTDAVFDIDQSSGDILNRFNTGGTEAFTKEVSITSNAPDAAVAWLDGAY
mgnify:FL=1